MKKSIRVTKNYDQFTSQVKGNRPINIGHLEKMIKIMKDDYIPNPIIVNSKLEVMDGQHRLEACKHHQLPVYYIVTDDWEIKQIQTINSVVRKWTLADYVHSFKALENKLAGPYTQLDWYTKKYGLPLECSIMILHNNGNYINKDVLDQFKKGNLQINDLKWATSFGNFLLKVKPFFKYYNSRGFIHAVLQMDKDHRFSRPVFLKRLEINSMKMRRCTNVIDYFDMAEYIFNCGARPKVQFERKEKWVTGYKPLR